MSESAPPRLSDSPWFWVYLFGAAALIAMFLIGQKADTVQAQRDGNFTRRQLSIERQAAQRAGEATPPVVEPTSVREPPGESPPPLAETELVEPRYVDFKIFYGIIGAITVVAWIMHWRQFLQRRTAFSSSLQKPA